MLVVYDINTTIIIMIVSAMIRSGTRMIKTKSSLVIPQVHARNGTAMLVVAEKKIYEGTICVYFKLSVRIIVF